MVWRRLSIRGSVTGERHLVHSVLQDRSTLRYEVPALPMRGFRFCQAGDDRLAVDGLALGLIPTLRDRVLYPRPADRTAVAPHIMAITR
jgi:hypothetical protein